MIWDSQTAGNMLRLKSGENVVDEDYTDGVVDCDLVKIWDGEIEKGDAVTLKVPRSSFHTDLS
jgi:hypothetical protein